MVDTTKENSSEDKATPVEDEPPKTQPKRRRQRRRSKSRRSKDNYTGTGEDNTSDGAEDNEHPVEATSEQDEQEDGESTLMNRPHTKTRGTAIIFHSPRMR